MRGLVEISGVLPSHSNRCGALVNPYARLASRAANRDYLERVADRLAAQADLLVMARDAARGGGMGDIMSVLDKLNLVIQRRVEHERHMSDRADATLARYAASGEKVDRAFDKHDQRLDAEDKQLDATEAVIDRLSNAADGEHDLGNSSGSGQSSGQHLNGGKQA